MSSGPSFPSICGLVYKCSNSVPLKANVVAQDGCLYYLALKSTLIVGRVYELENFEVDGKEIIQTSRSRVVPLVNETVFDDHLAHTFLLPEAHPSHTFLSVTVIRQFEDKIILQADEIMLELRELAFILFTRFCRGRGPFTIQLDGTMDQGLDTYIHCYKAAIWIIPDSDCVAIIRGRVVSFTHPQSACGGLRQCSRCDNLWGSSSESIASQEDEVLQ